MVLEQDLPRLHRHPRPRRVAGRKLAIAGLLFAGRRLKRLSAKSDRVEATDPVTDCPTRLFNPRIDEWNDHFQWCGYEVLGLTEIGRATIAVLDLNHPRRFRIREVEALVGLFPPDEIVG
jgi:hypothetical protein